MSVLAGLPTAAALFAVVYLVAASGSRFIALGVCAVGFWWLLRVLRKGREAA